MQRHSVLTMLCAGETDDIRVHCVCVCVCVWVVPDSDQFCDSCLSL